jgi:hypothetical protein
MVTLIIKGGNIDLHPSEAFTKVRRRIEAAKKNRLDYELGNSEKFNDGAATQLMFFTDLGEIEDGDDAGEIAAGRIFVDVGDVIGCMSDEYKDKAGEGPLPEKESDDDEDED